MPIKILKMRTGEEIIASIVENFTGETVTGYRIKNPCSIVPVPGKDGRYAGNMAMIPWMATAKQDSGLDIPADSVLFLADPITTLSNEYNEAFRGLVVPELKLST
jgi:hypothetical protein